MVCEILRYLGREFHELDPGRGGVRAESLKKKPYPNFYSFFSTGFSGKNRTEDGIVRVNASMQLKVFKLADEHKTTTFEKILGSKVTTIRPRRSCATKLLVSQGTPHSSSN
ncbi:hypothetical protein AMECASPLE_035461 [Ameca splendens]|uniref:Uncharacterized protein n=1 Tax=Ameca splendens TaxID=208324 RepID=A0ABV0Z5C5_9TELE